MNIFKGSLLATSDPQELSLGFDPNSYRVLFLGDPAGEQDIINAFNMILATPLVPTYDMICKEFDGSSDEFDMLYLSYLNEPTAIEFFSTIMSAMFRGYNIILYFPQVSKDLRYVGDLLLNIEQQYGITPATKTTQYFYRESYNDSNLSVMYMNGTIMYQEFILYFSSTPTIPIIKKLAFDMKPYVENPKDINCYLRAFSDFRNSMLNAGKILYPAVSYEEPKF